MIDDHRPAQPGVSPLQFFLLTFALSWLIWIPLDLSHFGIGPLRIPEGASSIIRLLGVLMPATAGIILSGRSGGRPAIRAVLGRLAIWRVGWKWWMAAVLVYPGLLILTGLVYNRFAGGTPISFVAPASLTAFVVSTFFLLVATLGEEIGWRGVALPGLQQKRSPLVSSIILGVCSGIWHLPFWLLLDSYDQFGVPYFALNLTFVLPITIYITWFFNHSRSSLLLPVAFHLTFNIVNTALFPVTGSIGAFLLFVVLTWVLTLIIIGHLEPVSRSDPQRRTQSGAGAMPATSSGPEGGQKGAR